MTDSNRKPLPPPSFEPLAHLGTTVQAFVGRPESHDALLRRAARRWGRRTAVISPSGRLSYAEIDAAASTAAIALLDAVESISPQNTPPNTPPNNQDADRIAIALAHDLPLYLVPFVTSRSGLTALLLNTTLSPQRWAAQLQRARPVLVITDETTERAAKEAVGLSGLDIPVLSVTDALPTQTDRTPTADLEDHGGGAEQVLALIATSGTTGVPKMSQVTSGGLIHAGLAYAHLLGLTADDVSYICLPLYYIGPLSAQTTTMPLVGGTNVIPADTGAQTAGSQMAAVGATFLDAVPSWLGLMARAPAVDLPSWRTLIYGGAPMPPATAARLAERHPDLALWDVWGLSETHGPATGLRYDVAAPPLPGTVGRPIPGVEVRSDSATGGSGELLVRGANVTPGYADDPETTARVLDEGWLRTGDVGTVGPDGSVRLLDRAKDVIMRGGANVFSVEVEQSLASHPSVREAAVYGVADGLEGEAVAATVVLAEGHELDVMALRRQVADGVGRHAVPRKIEVAQRLPRNPTGKIDKARLRDQAAAKTTPEDDPS